MTSDGATVPGGKGRGLPGLMQVGHGDDKHQDAHSALLQYVSENAGRMDYPTYRQRGMQVGSGAMESLHCIASQMRLKLAGARWTPERALAVLNTRMMSLAKRWDDFWHQPNITDVLQVAFSEAQVQTS